MSFEKLMLFLALCLASLLRDCLLLPSLRSTVFDDSPTVQTAAAVASNCQFPDSYVGSYRIQDDSRPPAPMGPGIRESIKYKELYVGPTAIPLWGDCYEKIGHQYILGFKRVGGSMCYRCFVIIQRTPNIIQLNIKDVNTCYVSVEEARTTCPNAALLGAGEGVMLWKYGDVTYEYCPLAGRANLSYSMGENGQFHCEFPTLSQPSTASNCRRGFQMDISFRSCNFQDYEISLKCLGVWNAGRGNGEMFFGVYNPDADEYRCGMFLDDRSQRGIAHAALSNDSSCSSLLTNSSQGAEVFTLYPSITPQWPAPPETCSFPKWLQGDWEDLSISDSLISYYNHDDPSTAMTVYAKCVACEHNKYRVFSKTHCSDPIGYHCIWIEMRSPSVLEFKMGDVILKHDDSLLCQNDNAYSNVSWTTLSTRSPQVFTTCPMLGSFVTISDQGPDSDQQFCVKFATDCNRNDTFKYTVHICGTNIIYDVSEYRCLATWQEGDIQYTYTMRNYDGSRSCFASQFVNGQLHMLWSGLNCDRSVRMSNQNRLTSRDEKAKSFALDEVDSCYHQGLLTTALRPLTGGDPNRNYRPTAPKTTHGPNEVNYSFGTVPSVAVSWRRINLVSLLILVAAIVCSH